VNSNDISGILSEVRLRSGGQAGCSIECRSQEVLRYECPMGIQNSYDQGHRLVFRRQGRGDFACHIFDPVFTALELSHCLTVRAEVPDTNKETFPAWQIARFTFPGTKYTAQKTINGTWCNGSKRPSRDLVPMPPEYNLSGAGSIIVGEQGVMVLPHWAAPQLYPHDKFKG